MNEEQGSPEAQAALKPTARCTTQNERFLLIASGSLAVLLIIATIVVVVVTIPQSKDTAVSTSTTTASDSVLVTEAPTDSGNLHGPSHVITTSQSSPPPSPPPKLTSPEPTKRPAEPPSRQPTVPPTQRPTSPPSMLPTVPPSMLPTVPPTVVPTKMPIAPPRPDEPLDLVYLAYYYPWYMVDEWDRHGRQDDPMLGYYSTNDPVIAEQHIEWAKRAGIDVFVASWDGPDSPREAAHLQEGLFQAPNINDIKFCVLYESLGALPTVDFADGSALAKLISDMQWVEANYFGLPFYYRVNDGLIQQLQLFSCLKRPDWYEEGSFPTMIFITTFNECWESTQSGGKYSFEFIAALKQFKDSGYVCPLHSVAVAIRRDCVGCVKLYWASIGSFGG